MKPLPIELAKQAVDTVNSLTKRGFKLNNGIPSAVREAARLLKLDAGTLHTRLRTAKRLYNLEPVIPEIKLEEPEPPSPFALEYKQASQSWTGGHAVVLDSRPDNTFLFGAAGDLHAASKYCRWDVREDLYKLFREEGAQCNFDTGNWIDGESRFNTYDLEVRGLDEQCNLLARQHPRGVKTYAVWGDDHEGWYVQREGIDVGRYCENVMQSQGHDWVNLGFMEAHVELRNANTGKSSTLAVVHPGGGSAYALSYSIQKIVESLEGGEKPSVGLYGHYHKLWSGVIRNIFVAQTGCAQDQTPFMRKKRLEAHVGGLLIKLRQDPATGSIISMVPEIIRYFNRSFHLGTNRWSRHGSVIQVPRVMLQNNGSVGGKGAGDVVECEFDEEQNDRDADKRKVVRRQSRRVKAGRRSDHKRHRRR